MNLQEFESIFPALWLVFANSYLNYENAPKAQIDQREKSLVDLLVIYLESQLVAKQFSSVKPELIKIINLLKLWSQDLTTLYAIRQQKNKSSSVESLAKQFLARIQQFDDCTLLPNGLISAKHNNKNENVSLAILKRNGRCIDWIQFDPGCIYHQRYQALSGLKYNAYLEIKDIEPQQFNQEWLKLLVGLKAVDPGGYYKDVSLYECLLAQLNGKTAFKSLPDQAFIHCSNNSPTHTWQVVEQALAYLLAHFNCAELQGQLIVGFKLFLLKETFSAYLHPNNKQFAECHYLLQEMCKDIAESSIAYATDEQKIAAVALIDKVKISLKENVCEQYRRQSDRHQLDAEQLAIASLHFVKPTLYDSSNQIVSVNIPSLQAEPFFEKYAGENIIAYLQTFKLNFIQKLNLNTLHQLSLLSAGIESFFIDCLANTSILNIGIGNKPFSENDLYLAESIKELAELYYACQSKLVNDYLKELTYQPQFFAKNIAVQFFAYAAIAALNYRDSQIGPLLRQYNLCTAASATIEFNQLLDHLVIDDSKLLAVLFKLKQFFASSAQKNTLFSYSKFDKYSFQFTLKNTSEQTDTEVAFAYQLLQKNFMLYRQFCNDYQELEEEKYNQKWYALAYTNKYLPPLFCLLLNAAFTAKAALLTLPKLGGNSFNCGWVRRQNFRHYWLIEVSFQINSSTLNPSLSLEKFVSYTLKNIRHKHYCSSADPYQRLVVNNHTHLAENDVIASQSEKPSALERLNYLTLGFLQSQPMLKIERLYIALKQQALDVIHEQHCVLLKQALFETSVIYQFQNNKGYCSLLQYTALTNPELIHQLGLLCVEKALAMKLRLTQHHVVGEMIEIGLGLLAFYPEVHKQAFVTALDKIYQMLDATLLQPPAHLKDNTLLHLHAYLILCAQNKPALNAEITGKIINSLVAIEKYRVNNVSLDNAVLRQVYSACFHLTRQIEQQLDQHPDILSQLMQSMLPTWKQNQEWQKVDEDLLYKNGHYAIKPLLGLIYFQNKPIQGLPREIIAHKVYKEYFGDSCFAVLPSERLLNNLRQPCYFSVDRTPQIRITAIGKQLFIEELINSEFQLYIPAEDLLKHHPQSLYKQPNGIRYYHWLSKDSILFKDSQRHIFYEWKLSQNHIHSIQHKGILVPWAQVKDSPAKSLLQRIESSGWIEMIVKDVGMSIQSLHFLRLGLSFHFLHQQFFSQQLHGYAIAKQQQLATLPGLSHYLLLEKSQPSSKTKQSKVIIPHYKLSAAGPFYSNNIHMDFDAIQKPGYFVYDVDRSLGLLKANSIAARLYLALLYYVGASLDEDGMSESNGYHLARENLEACWKAQPYNAVELALFEQLLNEQTMRDRHYNRIAIYLKGIALLSSSLQLGFLYTNPQAEENKKKTVKLLQKCGEKLPSLYATYLENQAKVFKRIQLKIEEEQEVIKHVFYIDHGYTKQFRAVEQSINQQPAVLTSPSGKSYKQHYQQIFAQDQLASTAFAKSFTAFLDKMQFSSTSEPLDFSRGIDGIYTARFRLDYFLQLYKLAQSFPSKIKYRYLLHHMLLRAKILRDTLPTDLVMLLGRVLLLVLENPHQFPSVPQWLKEIECNFDLTKRSLTKESVCANFPKVYRYGRYDDDYEQRLKADEQENQRIWNFLDRYDLDINCIPRLLPINQHYFSLNYERYININDNQKRTLVKEAYLSVARNHAMFQFFTTIMQQCDKLKHYSQMGWEIAPVISHALVEKVAPKQQEVKANAQQINLEKWAIHQPELVSFKQFFSHHSQPQSALEFPFEEQLKEEQGGYHQQFYCELKKSWQFYLAETKLDYQWLKKESIEQLDIFLQQKQLECQQQAEKIWDKLAEQFKYRSATSAGRNFALKWYSGQIAHYHKADILTLILAPHKIVDYHPELVEKTESIMQDLLAYLSFEINYAKTIRLLGLLEQYKKTLSESEKSSLLHRLVATLQESIDNSSYRYPHWLLFQFENHVIIRHNQQELIFAMLAQTGKGMYQLNMGEGKSSVILPLLSYDLANHQQLLRINVLYPLFVTMRDLLHQRFSGLIKKQIYTLPFYRDTDISIEHLKLLLKTLNDCQRNHHILLVTPEHRMCLQLKLREIMLENQQQLTADGVFNWQTYRQRSSYQAEAYQDLSDELRQQLLAEQDKKLKEQLVRDGYLDAKNKIIKIPPRGSGRKEFAKFKEAINEPKFREWSCLKAAYREILFNSTLAYADSSEKLVLLKQISEIAALDLLDESDEILRHGTELNYTMGDKTLFAGGELRWQIPQFFIDVIFNDPEVRKIILAGQMQGFTDINLKPCEQGRVPYINLLDKNYFEQQIKPLLYRKFIEAYLPVFRKHQLKADEPVNKNLNASIKDYILGQLSLKEEKQMLIVLADKEQLKDSILIAKGWLSYGILFHVFNAKYRVKFGLNRDLSNELSKPIAVPFFGKDAPSKRSEFSHPDVMLGFTIISYLYEGLNKQQLKNSLLKLKDKYSHQVADQHLAGWVKASQAVMGVELPQWLHSFESLDLADEHCLENVRRYLAQNPNAILFYLNQFVLAEEAFQYRYKISANAHSLVGYNPALGFSGTDDRKITMPHQILSLRSATQEGTNGKLLYVLSRERNSQYYSLNVNDAIELLQQFCNHVKQQPNCHIIIDAGALVTGLSNYQVACFLIKHLPEKFQGIIYFSDEGNQLTVLMRNEQLQPLHDCHINKQNLFAYLDDVHTRGTDLQLPLDCQGILTIGIGMQKDKLMQAAMRLRQLAQMQSVTLWGTQKVTLAIARDNHIVPDQINSVEVIKWVTRNTINQINSDLFSVAVRKIKFLFTQLAESLLKEAPDRISALADYCQEQELFTLEDFYSLSPQVEDLGDRLYLMVAQRIKSFWQALQQELIEKQLADTPFYKKVFAPEIKRSLRIELYKICDEVVDYLQQGQVQNALDNDQEKEVEVEIIQEKNVMVSIEKREPHAEKDWDVQLILCHDFIMQAQQQGILQPIKNIANYIQQPTLNALHWHHDIYFTMNFIQATTPKKNEGMDNYLRPVDVILIHRLGKKSICVILSGEEAARIKSDCVLEADANLLIHLNDIEGPTMSPVGCSITKEELKLLTIIKLFAGECHYPDAKEIQRLAKRIGKIYPHYFVNQALGIDKKGSAELYGILIEKKYLDFTGIMTADLLVILNKLKSPSPFDFDLGASYKQYNEHVLQKLFGLYQKLIIQPQNSIRDSHYTLWQWVGTRGRLKEYSGSALESVLNHGVK